MTCKMSTKLLVVLSFSFFPCLFTSDASACPGPTPLPSRQSDLQLRSGIWQEVRRDDGSSLWLLSAYLDLRERGSERIWIVAVKDMWVFLRTA